ncbi:MAG: MlaD family protein [Paracoccus sp. (in: a-proteobacteria)]|uniref:PqiB family protein n=1 Tax=Paracoccus sp. TaxID=267 RepID=UPI0026E0076A|nr:MlaD family protein [Paracoccus sp. (in: a-proteobacteria)]MDO5612601.1 MlaD family protein [Paracoccus sp. (in: a-proteobacteria)]
MTDTPPPLQPASPVRRTARRAAQAGVNIIWLVPILALIVTLAIGWNSYMGRGTLIHVAFRDATGINPGETPLKFREINVGKVEAVRFTEDLSSVIVDIRVDRDLAQYIDDQAEFWIVRPQVTARGITRLDTVLTGAFIEGYWDADVTEPRSDFIGMDRAPLTRDDAKGTWVIVQTDDAEGLSEGAPVMYRGLPVGRMENLRISPDGEGVQADVFVEAPHDRRLTTASVFWDSGGVSVSLGTQGVSVGVNSLASLLQGGIQFGTFVSGGRPVERGHVFALNADEDAARSNIFAGDESGQPRFTLLLEQGVRGLERGADVQFQGLSVGRVTDLSVRVRTDQPGQAREVFQQVTVALSPARLGLAPDATGDQVTAFIASAVEQGLRARPASAGFLGASLMIELFQLPEPPQQPLALDMAGDPYPIIPSVSGDLSDFSDTAQGMLSRIGNLPIEEVLKSATDMMNSITHLASSPDTRAIPETLRRTLDDAQSTSSDIRDMVQDFKGSGAVDNLNTLLSEASAAAQSLREAAANAPDMIEKMDRAAARIEEFNFAEISAQAEGILQDLRVMLGSEDAEQLPRHLSDTLQAASGLLNDLRDGNAAGSLNAALGSARVAADEVAVAVRDLPQLVQRLQQTAGRAEAVIAAYGDRSSFNTEAVTMLRELRRATAAFGSLARTIERNPRAFILGR